MSRSDEPVEIARFSNIHQAELACSVLKGSGVEAFIDQEFAGSIAPHTMFNAGGIRLYVAAPWKERALEVLQALEGDTLDSRDE